MIFHFIRRFIVDAYYEIKEGIFLLWLAFKEIRLAAFCHFCKLIS